MKRDPLAPKRAELEGLMLAHFARRAQAWRDNSTADISARDIEKTSNAAEVRRVIARMDEVTLDSLLMHYSPEPAPLRLVAP